MADSASRAVAVVDRFLELRGGFVVPVEALRLVLSLEDRGATFALDGDDVIVDGPAGVPTAEDAVALRRWKRHVKAIITYRPPAREDLA